MVKTLGYHRKMCVAVFGEDSPATKFLDGKIAEQGEDEEVLADERQLIAVLMSLHMGEPAETQEE
jgi:hypothetical protein